MHRRGFVATFTSALLAPLYFLLGKPAKAELPTGCPAGDPEKPTTDYKWFDKHHVAPMQDFKSVYDGEWHPETDYKPSDRLIPVDHSILRWAGTSVPCKYGRAPWITLEHWDGEDDTGTPGKLTIDQLMPCRVMEVQSGRTFPDVPQMERALQFDLSDPYQLLLADLLVRGLMDAGVIDNEEFVAAWQQVVMDCQANQFDPQVREDDPDAPVEFIVGTVSRTMQQAHKPSRDPKAAPGCCYHTRPNNVVASQLQEHLRRLNEQDRRRRRVPEPPFLRG